MLGTEWVRSFTMLQEKYQVLCCRDIGLRLRRYCMFLRTVHNSYIFPSGLHFSQACSCKTKLPRQTSPTWPKDPVFRRVDWKKDSNVLVFLSPFPEIAITGKCWNLGSQVLTWDGKSYALGSYANNLWVTWNLHVTCWTQTLEKTNLLLI